MIILACETSTLLGSVAISKNGQLLSEKQLLRQGSHSDILNPFINDCLLAANLKLSDIDCFATGLGPGSFTGIRISLNTIKTLGFIFKKPTAGKNSLFNLAYQAKSCLNSQSKNSGLKKITSIINAYKNMLYISQYELTDQNPLGLLEVFSPQVVRVQEIEQHLQEKTLVVGDGFAAYEKYFSATSLANMIRSSEALDQPSARALSEIAFCDPTFFKTHTWQELLPIYLRASEAEENLSGIKYQPL